MPGARIAAVKELALLVGEFLFIALTAALKGIDDVVHISQMGN